MNKLKTVMLQSTLGKVAMATMALGAASTAVVVGTHAAWTDQTLNPSNDLASGTLSISNDKAGASVFTATGIKPGDTGSGTVTIENDGTTNVDVKLTQDTLTDNFAAGSLKLKIHDDTNDWCYWPATGSGACATYGNWDATGTVSNLVMRDAADAATAWAAAEVAHTYTVSWQLIAGAPNGDQNKTASFRLVWDAS